ncbi:MAG: hypothetical protein FWH21_03490 [Kiritimatiellaeota bacterium]|nr:hypothetical protein [Kiritimatiellota bacterium]
MRPDAVLWSAVARRRFHAWGSPHAPVTGRTHGSAPTTVPARGLAAAFQKLRLLDTGTRAFSLWGEVDTRFLTML